MKKFLLTSSMTALVLCLALQPSYGMKREREESEKSVSTSHKPPLDDDFQTLSEEEVMNPHPISLDDAPKPIYADGKHLYDFCAIIASSLDVDPLFDRKNTFQFRCLNKQLKQAIDLNIKALDFSPLPRRIDWEHEQSAQFPDIDGNQFWHTANGVLFLWKGEGEPNYLLDDKWYLCCWYGSLSCKVFPANWQFDEQSQSYTVVSIEKDPLPHPYRHRFEAEISIDCTNFSNLLTLCLRNNAWVKDQDLKSLSRLTNLDLSHDNIITNEGVSSLSALKMLNLYKNKTITDEGLSSLTQLTNLNLDYNRTITDEGLSHLTNLKVLTMEGDLSLITDKSVDCLTQLEELMLSEYYDTNLCVRLSSLRSLPNLKALSGVCHWEDIGVVLSFPSLRKLHVQTDYDSQNVYKVAIDIADALFISLEDKIDLSVLKKEYNNLVFSITSLYPELNSKLLDKEAPINFTWESLQKLLKKAYEKGEFLAKGYGEVAELLEEFHAPMIKIIKKLFEFSGKKLEIRYQKTDDIDGDKDFFDESESWILT